MAQTYYNIHPASLHKYFPHVSPCDCHSENAYNPPLYNVRTSTASSYIVGRGPLIKEIHVYCSSCNKENCFNVESSDVYENDLSLY